MAFPKPEYIQNFIEEKLKKTKKTEKLPLLNGDEFSKQVCFYLSHNPILLKFSSCVSFSRIRC